MFCNCCSTTELLRYNRGVLFKVTCPAMTSGREERNRTSDTCTQIAKNTLLLVSITGHIKRVIPLHHFPDEIPHCRWRIVHAALPINSNYELDNGLVASVGFLMYTHPRAGSWIRTSDPRVKSH